MYKPQAMLVGTPPRSLDSTMAVGYTIDQATINNVVGSTVVQLRDTFADIRRLNNLFADKTAEQLATKYGYTIEEAQLLKASLFDLAKLSRIAAGQAEQVGNNDFFWNAGQLAGLN